MENDAGLLDNDDFSIAFDAAIDGTIDNDTQADTQAADGAQADTQAADGPQADTQAADGAQADTQAADGAQADTQAADGAQADTQAADGAQADQTMSVEDIAKKAAEDLLAKKAAEDEAAAKKKVEDEAAVAAVEAAQVAEKPTAEEQVLLDSVVEDFPEVAKALDVVQRMTIAKMSNLFQQKLDDFAQRISPSLTAANSAAQTVASNEHTKTILAKHADAFELLPDIEKWVNNQPDIHKTTYNDILDSGSPEQVISLLNIFKESNKSVASTSSEEAAAQVAAEKEREKKLQAQEGVKSRQTTKQGSLDPNDFSGAFEQFASQ